MWHWFRVEDFFGGLHFRIEQGASVPILAAEPVALVESVGRHPNRERNSNVPNRQRPAHHCDEPLALVLADVAGP